MGRCAVHPEVWQGFEWEKGWGQDPVQGCAWRHLQGQLLRKIWGPTIALVFCTKWKHLLIQGESVRNELVIRVQPNESVYCKVSNSKGLQDNHLPFLTADHLTLRSSNFNVTPAFVYLTCLYFYTSTFIPLLFLPLPTSTFIPLWTPTPTFLPLLVYLYILGDDQDPWDVIQPAGDRAGFDLQVQIQVYVFQWNEHKVCVFLGGVCSSLTLTQGSPPSWSVWASHPWRLCRLPDAFCQVVYQVNCRQGCFLWHLNGRWNVPGVMNWPRPGGSSPLSSMQLTMRSHNPSSESISQTPSLESISWRLSLESISRVHLLNSIPWVHL